MTKGLLASAVLSAVAFAEAGSLFDFNTAEGRKAVLSVWRSDYRSGTTNFMASAGGYSAFLKAKPWTPGNYEYPSLYLTLSANHDWSGCDRLVVDLANFGTDGDILTLCAMDATCSSSEAFMRSTPLPCWGTKRWVLDLDYWPDTVASNAITRLQLYAHKPQSVAVYIDRFTLLKPGEPLPPLPAYVPGDLATLAAGRAAYDAEVAARRNAFLAQLAAENLAAGLSTNVLLIGYAPSTDGVRPKDTFSAKGPRNLKLRLARGETEALQLLVTPNGQDLRRVKVVASRLERRRYANLAPAPSAWLPDDAVTVSPVGYVETTSRPHYDVGYTVASSAEPGYERRTKRAELGWWPDPILGFTNAVDVADGDVQSFWVSVKVPDDAPAGIYEGALQVTASTVQQTSEEKVEKRGGGGQSINRLIEYSNNRMNETIKLPFSVRVNDFAIPKTPPMNVVVSFSPCVYIRPAPNDRRDRDFAARMAEKPDAPINAWKEQRMAWADFLADRYVTMQKLYQHADADICYDVYDRLREQGRMGDYNIFYFSTQSLDTPAWTTWMNWVSSEISQRLKKAAAHGIADNAIVYCCDETSERRLDEIVPILDRLHADFPALRVYSTCQDKTYGLDGRLAKMTGFIPTTDRYDPERAAASRAAGHEVWWYYACNQVAPMPNVFTECQPIEQRLLMGAMAARYRPDGFLYYQIAYFNSENCITSGPYTDWNPRSWSRQHGDATWAAVGPGGMPLTTIRFENFRDGLEDLWYAELLREKLEANPSAGWAGRARMLLDVPRTVVDSLTNYTDRAEVLTAWRDGMADLLEEGVYTIHAGDVTALTNVLSFAGTHRTFFLEPGVYDLAALTNAPMSRSPDWWGPSLLAVPNGSTLAGLGDAASDTVLRGADAMRLMCVSGNCTIRNLTFEGGNALTGGSNAKYCSGGALVTTGSAPTVTNCIFRNNRARYGGAVNGITARDCLFVGNHTEGYGFGGAGYLGRYYGCTVVSNAATDVWANGGGLSGASVVDGCTVVSNVAAYAGGGLGECRGVRNSTVAYNAAVGPKNARGGGLYLCGTITNCTVACNLASGYAHGMVDTSAVGSSFRFNGSSHHARNDSKYVARLERCDLVGSAVCNAELHACRVHHVSNVVAVADNVHYGPCARGVTYGFTDCPLLRNVLVDGCWITNLANHACFYAGERALSVENCTIASNAFTYTLRGYSGARTATFVNTVLCGNRRGAAWRDWAAYESPATNLEHCVVGLAEPRFVGKGAHPYMPLRTSPLVGIGKVLGWMAEEGSDLADRPRVKRGAVDVGAYQCWIGTMITF